MTRDLTHVTRVMKQELSLWHLDDLNSKMEIYFRAILRGLKNWNILVNFWNFIEKRKWWNVLFHTVFVTVSTDRTILPSDDPWIQYSLCFLTIFVFICCLKLIGWSSIVFIPAIARSILIGRPMRKLYSILKKQKNEKRESY